MRKNYHFILQGKGGVGKTTVSTFITQYVKDYLKLNYLAIDTDQVNASFTKFDALNVENFNVMIDNVITDTGWEDLMNKIINSDKSNIIIDNGASSFVPLLNYVYENNIFDILLSDENSNIFIHIVIAGGEGLTHTLAGLNMICEKFNNIQIIVWINNFLGNVETQNNTIENYEEYKNNSNKILEVVRIPTYKGDLFKKDLVDMLSNHKTYNEMLADIKINLFTKSRVKRMQQELFEELEKISFIFDEEE